MCHKMLPHIRYYVLTKTHIDSKSTLLGQPTKSEHDCHLGNKILINVKFLDLIIALNAIILKRKYTLKYLGVKKHSVCNFLL